MLGFFDSDKFPCELTEGQKCTRYFPLREVVDGLKKEGFSGRIALRAVFRDALDNEHKSARLVGNIEQWAKIAGR